jgi:cytochrome b561
MTADTSFRAGMVAVRRYTATAQVLHWITAALMFTVLPLAWVMMNMPETVHARSTLFTLHKSVGLTIVALVAVRIIWRAKHPAPPLENGLAQWDKRAAFASHWLLYVVLVGMPVSGYLLDATGGYPITYLGLITVPVLPNVPAIASAATWTHVVVGQWLVYALILLHVGASVWHVVIRRDNVLDRMLPEQQPGPAAPGILGIGLPGVDRQLRRADQR